MKYLVTGYHTSLAKRNFSMYFDNLSEAKLRAFALMDTPGSFSVSILEVETLFEARKSKGENGAHIIKDI